MVAALSASLFSPTSAAGPSGGGREDSGKESARIKAEILSARSEKQCTTCEGDNKKLDEQIKQLETKLRQVQSTTTVDAPKSADSPDVAEKRNAADGSNATAGLTGATAATERFSAVQTASESDDSGNASASRASRARPPLDEPGHVLDISV